MGCGRGSLQQRVSEPALTSSSALDPSDIQVLHLANVAEGKARSRKQPALAGPVSVDDPKAKEAGRPPPTVYQPEVKPRVDCWRPGEAGRRASQQGKDLPADAVAKPEEGSRRASQLRTPEAAPGPRPGIRPEPQRRAESAPPGAPAAAVAPRKAAPSTPTARPSWRGAGATPMPKKEPARRTSAKGKGKGPSKPEEKLDLDEHEKALLSEVLDRSPGVSWEAIAGLDEVKRLFYEIVVAPVKNPLLFSGVRSPPKGVLLFGPPGNGKTMLAKAVASECNATFFSISASSLTSKWVGESEKQMRALFSLARKMQPAVIFMDEIDSMLTSRSAGEHEAARRLKTEFLVQLDGAASGGDDRVLVLGATNRPSELDDAVLRRLPRRILIPLPDATTRSALVSKELHGARHNLTSADFNRLASMTEGYSCSDLAALTREAAMGPVRGLRPEVMVSATPDGIRAIVLTDFQAAIHKVKPSLSKEALSEFHRWNRAFGSN